MKRVIDLVSSDSEETVDYKKARRGVPAPAPLVAAARAAVAQDLQTVLGRNPDALRDALFFNENGGPAMLSKLREAGVFSPDVPDHNFSKLLVDEFRHPVSLAPHPTVTFVKRMHALLQSEEVRRSIPQGESVLAPRFWRYAYYFCSLMARVAALTTMMDHRRWAYVYGLNHHFFISRITPKAAASQAYLNDTALFRRGPPPDEEEPEGPVPNLYDISRGRSCNFDYYSRREPLNEVPWNDRATTSILGQDWLEDFEMRVHPQEALSEREAEYLRRESEDFTLAFDADVALVSTMAKTVRPADPLTTAAGIGLVYRENIHFNTEAADMDLIEGIEFRVLLVAALEPDEEDPDELTGLYLDIDGVPAPDELGPSDFIWPPPLARGGAPPSDIAERLWRDAIAPTDLRVYVTLTLRPGVNKCFCSLVDELSSGFRVLQTDRFTWTPEGFTHRATIRYVSVDLDYSKAFSMATLGVDPQNWNNDDDGEDRPFILVDMVDDVEHLAGPRRDEAPYPTPGNIWGNWEWLKRWERHLHDNKRERDHPHLWAYLRAEMVELPEGYLIEFPVYMITWLNPPAVLERPIKGYAVDGMEELMRERHPLLCYWLYVQRFVMERVPLTDKNGMIRSGQTLIHYQCRACQSSEVTHVHADGSGGYCEEHAGSLI